MGKRGYTIKKETKTIVTPTPKADVDLSKPDRTKAQPPAVNPFYHPDDFYDGVTPEKKRKAIIAANTDENADTEIA